MEDTPEYIKKKQFEIIRSKPFAERWEMAFDLAELSRQIIQNRIKEERPDISEIDLKLELFRRFYKQDFDEETMVMIVESMREYLTRNFE